jgi:polyisoprenoid-binding protein YceI
MNTGEDVVRNAAFAGAYHLSVDGSHLTFSNKTFWGALAVKGRFTEFDGGGRLDGDGAVTGQVVIRAASLRTGIRKRDEHLRSDDFFAVTEFPDIKVVVTGVAAAVPPSLQLQATLTVKDRTEPIVLPAEVSVIDDHTVAVSTEISVQRHTFGVTGNQLGMVGPTTTLSGRLVFRRANTTT